MREGLDEFFMAEALKEAEKARLVDEVPIGAVVVSAEGEIIGRGHNEVIRRLDPTAHAEILALKEAAQRLANYRLLGTSIYVTIEPCPMCAGALVLARVSRLVFGARDPKSGACGSLYQIARDPRLNHRLEVVSGVLEKQCRGIIQAFFKERR
ncbi:tRNA adenosine(34) deaminase TadA [Thermosulfuriphilus sp.]